ncbi:MAG TPA: hypothetical protein VF255_08835 [Solirubrobacterales bacterium]
MSVETGAGGDGLEERIREAERRLEEAATLAAEAEKRVEAAERRASVAEETIADELARAREGAASWLQSQLDSLRREAEGR